MQESEAGSWHVPIVSGDDIETNRQWICATRAPLTVHAQSQSHIEQTEMHCASN